MKFRATLIAVAYAVTMTIFLANVSSNNSQVAETPNPSAITWTIAGK